MTEVASKTFRSGNSTAVRLPKELAVEPGTEVTIRKVGDTLTITPKPKKTLAGLIRALERLPKPGSAFKRERIDFPKRRGI